MHFSQKYFYFICIDEFKAYFKLKSSESGQIDQKLLKDVVFHKRKSDGKPMGDIKSSNKFVPLFIKNK